MTSVLKTYLLSKYFGCWEADFFGGLKVQEFESAWEKVFSYNLAITVNPLKKIKFNEDYIEI